MLIAASSPEGVGHEERNKFSAFETQPRHSVGNESAVATRKEPASEVMKVPQHRTTFQNISAYYARKARHWRWHDLSIDQRAGFVTKQTERGVHHTTLFIASRMLNCTCRATHPLRFHPFEGPSGQRLQPGALLSTKQQILCIDFR